MAWTVRRLEPALIPDFYRLHSEARGGGWCYCVAWWVPAWEGWGERTAAMNRTFRQELFDRGELDGYLLYHEGEPIAWCQCGLRDRLPKLVASYGLEPDPQAWALSCFLVAPDHRGQGGARRLLAGVLEDLPRRGARHVQAFPRKGEDQEPGEVWTGPVGLFEGAGFRLERDHPSHPVFALRFQEERP